MTLVPGTQQIDLRYSELAESSCCLSCGGALDHAQPAPGEICVDLGSGRGQDVIRMAEAVGSGGFAYGVDVAEGMIRRAQRDARKLGLTNVDFRQSELESLPLPDAHVDLVLSNCTINHAQDKQRVWSEVHRILKAGGRFVVSDIYSVDEVPEEYRNDPTAVAECWAGAQTRPAYFDTLRAAGFDQVRVLEEGTPYPKGKIQCVSFTLLGQKKRPCCCGGC